LSRNSEIGVEGDGGLDLSGVSPPVDILSSSFLVSIEQENSLGLIPDQLSVEARGSSSVEVNVDEGRSGAFPVGAFNADTSKI